MPFIATLAMLVSARGLAQAISDRQTQLVTVDAINDIATTEVLGIPLLVYIFAAVVAVGWVVLNRTTFGRRTFASAATPRRPGWPASTSAGTPRCSTCCPGCAAASPPS